MCVRVCARVRAGVRLSLSLLLFFVDSPRKYTRNVYYCARNIYLNFEPAARPVDLCRILKNERGSRRKKKKEYTDCVSRRFYIIMRCDDDIPRRRARGGCPMSTGDDFCN